MDPSPNQMTEFNQWSDNWSKISPDDTESQIETFLKTSFWSSYKVVDGSITYTGDLVDGIRHGYGCLEAKNDLGKNVTLYNGLFLCGAIHSPIAELFNHKGEIEFRGEVFGGRKVRGQEFHFNGQLRYSGGFKNDKIHGSCCVVFGSGGKIEWEGKVDCGKFVGSFDLEKWQEGVSERKKDMAKLKKEFGCH